MSAIMKCGDCGEPISGTYFQLGAKTICEQDYEKNYRKKCSVCGEGVSGSYYTDKNGQIICANDYKAQQGGSLDCRKCGLEVGGEIVRAVDSLFHPECFQCCECEKNLANKDTPFIADAQKKVYCRDDYNKKYAPKCAACQEPIAPKAGEKSTPRLRALEKDWHPDCFICVDCKEKLGSENGKKCYPLDDNPMCKDCHKARLV